MKEQITFDDFDKVDIRVGTVISVKKNEKARKPSLVVEVDFGKAIGIKQSSAQITHYYNEDNLVVVFVWTTVGHVEFKKFKNKKELDDFFHEEYGWEVIE